MNENFYITGGTLPLDATSYVERRADAELLDGLRRGDFCYVLNTRQMGKSSLMIRTARRLKEENRRVIVLDLTAIGQNLTVDQWYYGLLGRMAPQIGDPTQEDALLTFWKTHRDLGPMQRFVEALRSVLLNSGAGVLRTPAPLIIFVDEIDAVRSLRFSADEFFAGIRECYNRRSSDPAFNHLTFCLLGVATPADLIQDTRISPFNIGRRIELRDFTPDEAESLARGLSGGEGNGEKRDGDAGGEPNGDGLTPRALRILRRILYWTNGHPYMTQRMCRAVAESMQKSDAPLADEFEDMARVDALCQTLFLSRAAQETDDNLMFVRNRLLQSEADRAALLDLYGRIRAGKRVRDDETNPLCAILRLSGAVVSERGQLKLRNRIYDTVFDAAWVTEHMPQAEVRRQRRAYRAGLLRATIVGGAVTLLIGILAGVAIDRARVANRESERATRQEKLSNARLSRSYVETGLRLMAAGDYTAALAPLAEAMALDKDDESRMMQHRRRFASAVNLSPRLEGITFSEKPLRWAGFSPDGRWRAAAGDDGRARLWDAATNEELPLDIRHDGPIAYAAFSPDSARIVTCGGDATAKIWDLRQRRLLCTLHFPKWTGGRRQVSHASWSRDGSLLATAYFSLNVVWDLSGLGAANAKPDYTTLVPHYPQNDLPPLTHPDLYGDNGARVRLQNHENNAEWTVNLISPDGTHFAPLARNYSGRVVDMATNEMRFPLGSGSLERRQITGCWIGEWGEYSADGKRILVAGGFGIRRALSGATVYDAATGEALLRLPHAGKGLYAAYSADNRRIVTASEDHMARLWDAADGKPLTPPLRHEGAVTFAEFSRDGRRFLTAGADRTARVWDAATGKPLCAPIRCAGYVVAAHFGRDSDHIFTASRDGTARLWALPPSGVTPAPRLRLRHVSTPLPIDRDLFLNREGLPGRRFCDHETGAKRLLTPDGPPEFINCSASNDGGRVGLFGRNYLNYETSFAGPVRQVRIKGFDGREFRFPPFRNVQVWDARSGKALSPLFQADYAQISGDGSLLLLFDHNGTLRLMDAVTGEPRLPPFLTAMKVENVTGTNIFSAFTAASLFTPDSRGVVMTDNERRVHFLDVRTGRDLTPPMSHPTPVADWVFSPNGKYLFTYDEKQTLRAWNVADGTPASVPIRDSADATETIFSADGRRALSRVAADVLYWNLEDGAALRPQRIADTGIGAINLDRPKKLALSPDGQTFAALQTTTWLWDARTLSPRTPEQDRDAVVEGVAFSPDSRRVLAFRNDSTARIFDIATREPVTPPLPHEAEIQVAAFSPDGHIAATGDGAGIVRLWDADTGELLCPPLSGGQGEPKRFRFTADGRRLMVWMDRADSTKGGFAATDYFLWDIPAAPGDLSRLQAQSRLLSGQRIDPTLGVLPIDAAALRTAWKLLQERVSP